MNKLNFVRTFGPAAGMDALWDEAEGLGRTSLDTSIFDGRYTCTIIVKLPSGSTVYCHGESRDRHEALARAIAEAKTFV
jgi:hypothetical protein